MKELSTRARLASLISKAWLNANRLIIDVETTGLGEDAEIVEIAIINCGGEVILNTLVKPLKEIPEDATAIHGITNKMVENAPAWPEIHNQIAELISNLGFISYNVAYDVRLITQTAALYGLSVGDVDVDPLHDCAMQLFAEYIGCWDEHRNNFKRHKLTIAADVMGVEIKGQAHRASTDCLMTLDVIKGMAYANPKIHSRMR